jgi:hypothetical protein
MATPFVYMASVLTTVPHKFKESIPLLAFTADINYDSWDSSAIQDEVDLKRVPEDALNSGWITLAVPYAEQQQDFTLGARFELLRLFANNKPEVDWNATTMTDLRGNLKVEAYGKFPSSTPVPAMDPYRYKKFVQESRDSHWFMPHFVRISVRP